MDETTEQFEHGITRAWLDDGSICQMTTRATGTREAVDTWISCLLSAMDRFPVGEHALFLHDLTAEVRGFTRYARERATVTYAALPTDRPIYLAYVLPDAQINPVLADIMRARAVQHDNIVERIFSDKTDALAWLRGIRDGDSD